ncbi:MAG: DNA-binding response regulator [Owenweeksia sp.]|nr:DNA-binding response regulator [Owenweeksia sp.]MBF99118.1 DNA-binding response regulator [Owenweeksia sp.]|tara:strand:+ start:542 stop:1273 length:732 start_codon:yes stop_codon:yes gene_type:complete
MIKTILIDDEPLACDLVAEYLQDFPQLQVVSRCHDGFQGMKAIQEHQPDLIFLDVQMPKISGFELLELLEDPPAIIFTTAFDEYALKAFEANAVDYLLKPFSKERFEKAINKFLEHQPAEHKNIQQLAAQNPGSQPNRIVLKDSGQVRIIPVKDIIRLEADGDYVKIYSREGNFMKKKTLQHFEDTLSKEVFARIHRTHLLNISYLERIDPYHKNSHIARLKDGTYIPVSRTGYQRLKETLNI